MASTPSAITKQGFFNLAAEVPFSHYESTTYRIGKINYIWNLRCLLQAFRRQSRLCQKHSLGQQKSSMPFSDCESQKGCSAIRSIAKYIEEEMDFLDNVEREILSCPAVPYGYLADIARVWFRKSITTSWIFVFECVAKRPLKAFTDIHRKYLKQKHCHFPKKKQERLEKSRREKEDQDYLQGGLRILYLRRHFEITKQENGGTDTPGINENYLCDNLTRSFPKMTMHASSPPTPPKPKPPSLLRNVIHVDDDAVDEKPRSHKRRRRNHSSVRSRTSLKKPAIRND
ncbi:hypothetical protein ACLMJK_008871 [Lecanora helva]